GSWGVQMDAAPVAGRFFGGSIGMQAPDHDQRDALARAELGEERGGELGRRARALALVAVDPADPEHAPRPVPERRAAHRPALAAPRERGPPPCPPPLRGPRGPPAPPPP